MNGLSYTPFRLNTNQKGVRFYLCRNLSSWLGIDERKPVDERHEEDIPVEVSSFYGPFSLQKNDPNRILVCILTSPDFIETLKSVKNLSPRDRYIIADKDNNIIAEAILMPI